VGDLGRVRVLMSQRAQLICSLLVAVVIAVVVILLVSARVPVDDDDSGRGRGRGRGGDDDESFVMPATPPVRLDSSLTWRAQRTSTSPTRSSTASSG
jgi:hypothetical protein